MPSLVILNAGPDTAGCGIGLKRAFDKYADGWETRAICRKVIHFGYESDIVWPKGAPLTREVRDLVRQADVIHVMDAQYILRAFLPLRRQTVIVQHLGTHFRRDPQGVSAACRSFGATEVTDSIDLVAPHIAWLPVTTDTKSLRLLRNVLYQPTERVRIAHAPTYRAVKNTEQIIEVVAELAKRHPIDWDLIEGVSNTECLDRKAKADIFVDQLMYGFGVNNIECWSMGIPVVSGWETSDHRERSIQMFGRLPWADATPRTLEAVIEHLVLNRVWRETLGEIGREHAEKWHSQRSVVEQTLAVYEKARMRAAA